MTESQLLEKVSNAIGVAGQAGKHAFGNCWGSDNQATRATPNPYEAFFCQETNYSYGAVFFFFSASRLPAWPAIGLMY
jgi:hypothetical protein